MPGGRRSAGLMIGRGHVGFACASLGRAGPTITRVDTRKLEIPLFTGRPTESTVAALAKTLTELAPEAVRRYLPLHVSVPGPAVRIAVFPLDVLPGKRALRRDLAAWHFAQATRGGQALMCDCEPLGRDGSKHLLLGFAMDQAWHTCITEALTRAGMTAWSLNADVCRQFNRFHDHLCLDKHGGALFAATDDSWSLLVWDEMGRTRYASSRWRSGEDGECAGIAAEVERRILACVESLPDIRIEQIYLVAGALSDRLADAIDARLRQPCVRLDFAAGCDLAALAQDPAAPIAAAVQA